MRTKKVLALLLAAVMVFACALTGCGNKEDEDKKDRESSAESVLKEYIQADYALDYETVVDIGCDPYELEWRGYTREELIADMESERAEDEERNQNRFGDDVKVTQLEVSTVKKYDKDDVKSVARFFEEEYNYPEDAIQAVVIVEYKYKVEGTEDSNVFEGAWCMLKVDGAWTTEGHGLSVSRVEEIVNSWMESMRVAA